MSNCVVSSGAFGLPGDTVAEHCIEAPPPSSFAVCQPRRPRASSRDGGGVMNRPPSPLTMLLSRHTRRREFITLLGGVASAWPLPLIAQPPERVRCIGLLLAAASDDPEYQARIAAFLQGLQQLGWADGRNARIDTRWATTRTTGVM